MTRERREEVVLIALVVSVAIHVGLMLFAKTQVMVRSFVPTARLVRHEPMRVTKAVTRPEPVRVAEVADVAAPREAPVATTSQVAPGTRAPSAEESHHVSPPQVGNLPSVQPQPEAATVFDARPVGLEPAPVAPILKMETPSVVPSRTETPAFAAAAPLPVAPGLPVAPSMRATPADELLPGKMGGDAVIAYSPRDRNFPPYIEKGGRIIYKFNGINGYLTGLEMVVTPAS